MWRSRLVVPALGGLLVLPLGAEAHSTAPVAADPLVDVDVQVDGRVVPLYSAPDGSGRLYLEAREGSRYGISLRNRSTERVGVALSVDGLDAISGERTSGPGSGPPRMYILDAWNSTTVQGWRTSLSEVRQFTFVDEKASYAARSGAFNGRVGWIEVSVYRQRPRYVTREELAPKSAGEPRERRRENGADDGATADAPAPAAEAPRRDLRSAGRGGQPSFPGTGWGPRATDQAVLVDFDPESQPCQTVTLRYEYADALRSLGVLTAANEGRDRLRERERGEMAFARPPAH